MKLLKMIENSSDAIGSRVFVLAILSHLEFIGILFAFSLSNPNVLNVYLECVYGTHKTIIYLHTGEYIFQTKLLSG